MSEVVIKTPEIRTLVVGAAGLVEYQATVLAEAEQRVTKWQADYTTALAGVAAAERANEPDQLKLWRRRRTITLRRLGRAQAFQRVVNAGYLPIPRLPSVRIEMLSWRDNNKLLPPEALDALAEAKTIHGWTSFELVDGRDWRGRRLAARGRGVDPILVGVCDGEMFPLAWWR